MKLQELQNMLKQQNIKGGSYLNKPELISLLIEKRVHDSNILEQKEQAKLEMEEMKKLRAENNDRYKKLISIRNQRKRVEILEKRVELPHNHRCTKRVKHLDLELQRKTMEKQIRN